MPTAIGCGLSASPAKQRHWVVSRRGRLRVIVLVGGDAELIEVAHVEITVIRDRRRNYVSMPATGHDRSLELEA
jgi:hypothetical protein